MFGWGRKRNYNQRCVDVFATCNRNLRNELGEIIASHAAKGLLQSGSTIKRYNEAFETLTSAAVAALQTEFAAVVHDRSGEWARAIKAIGDAIEGQLYSAKHLLDRPFRIADGKPSEPAPKSGSIARAIEDELQQCAARLRSQHAAFADGWTAPLGKPWHERHPLLYAILAAIGGALIATLLNALAG